MKAFLAYTSDILKQAETEKSSTLIKLYVYSFACGIKRVMPYDYFPTSFRFGKGFFEPLLLFQRVLFDGFGRHIGFIGVVFAFERACIQKNDQHFIPFQRRLRFE